MSAPSGDAPELLHLAVPGQPGVTVPVLVDRIVWDFFAGMQRSVRIPGGVTPLDSLRTHHLEPAALNLFRTALARGADPATAATLAGAAVSRIVVPVAFVWRALEGAAQLPSAGGQVRGLLAEYLASRPAELAAVQDALGHALFPGELHQAVREVLAAARTVSRAN